MERKSFIQVPVQNIQKMMTHFNVAQCTVYNALHYRSYSELAIRIREEAVKNYGGVKTSKLIMK